MNSKVTALYHKDTGHLLAILTRNGCPDGEDGSDDVISCDFPYFNDDTNRFINIPKNELNIKICNSTDAKVSDLNAFQKPSNFIIDKNNIVPAIDSKNAITIEAPIHATGMTKIKVEKNGQMRTDEISALGIAFLKDSPTSAAIVDFKKTAITNSDIKSQVDVTFYFGPLDPGKNFKIIVFSESYSPFVGEATSTT